MSKRTIGYIVYYVLFALFAIYGTVKHWPMQIFVAIILLVEILCCLGGDNAVSSLGYHTRAPSTTASMDPKPKRDFSSLPFVSSLLILLPPILYFVIYTVVWCLL
ncbi:hypothetical protein [Pseudoflavonifractor hominis]|uniref:Uncharacterized protein n=1 Tax=Pseudoflavonifractor hominis TaxID=2763059 RepID=A0ABR7HRU3_9FIRM|nr:hypothetical protein [Pseudoflavonifractor hominis]MBC5730157.1 hypothetical protein [Pseudoflavonifractor hominis]